MSALPEDFNPHEYFASRRTGFFHSAHNYLHLLELKTEDHLEALGAMQERRGGSHDIIDFINDIFVYVEILKYLVEHPCPKNIKARPYLVGLLTGIEMIVQVSTNEEMLKTIAYTHKGQLLKEILDYTFEQYIALESSLKPETDR